MKNEKNNDNEKGHHLNNNKMWLMKFFDKGFKNNKEKKDNSKEPQKPAPKIPLPVFIFIILLAAFGLLSLFSSVFKACSPATPTAEELILSPGEFESRLGEISSITIEKGDTRWEIIGGKLKDDREFKTSIRLDALLRQKLEGTEAWLNRDEVEKEEKNYWGLIILGVMIIAIFIFNRAKKGNAQQQSQQNPFQATKIQREIQIRASKVTFNDVAGIDEAKQELQEVVEFLKNPVKFNALGARVPRGILLVGPPGTGKTLLARAAAGEAGVPFFEMAGSEFVEMFVGVGAARVRDLFDQAKKAAPCIIFVDELDAAGRQREAGIGGGHDEKQQTLNQILVEMDGFDRDTNVIVLGATNRPDILDTALLRSGRFDRQVVLDIPDVEGRRKILEIHTKNKPLRNVDLDKIAKATPGFTGADLDKLANVEAPILAARSNKEYIEEEDFIAAIDRVIAGPEKKSRIISPEEKRIKAYHEAGHALTAKLTPKAFPVEKISIIATMKAGGWTKFIPEDRAFWTKSQFLAQLKVALGGLTAEEIEFGERSTGAQDDLQRASRLASDMVKKFAMTDLGLRVLAEEENVFLGRDLTRRADCSDEKMAEVDKEIDKLLEENYREAKKVLEANRDKLEVLAQALIESEKLESEEINRILGLTNTNKDQKLNP